MARDHARLNLTIWQDSDWRALPPPAQHLYLTLWTHPLLSYAGVVDWRPGRIAAMAGGWTVDDVNAAAACLEARLFIVTDPMTEECLIRSWVRFDGLMKQPRMAVSMATAYAATASKDIRGVLIHELLKLRQMSPELPGWERPQVRSMLDCEHLDPRSRALPDDPLGLGLPIGLPIGLGLGLPIGLGETQPDVYPKVWGRATPSPAPAPSTSKAPSTSTAAQKRGQRLPDDFAVSDAMREWALDKAPAITDIKRETENFVDYWRSKTGREATKLDWLATWRKWMRTESDRRTNRASTSRKPSTTDQRVEDGLRLVAELRAEEAHQTAIGAT